MLEYLETSFHRNLHICFVTALALSPAACADETGIVIQVTTADPELAVDTLEIYVGVADDLSVDSYGIDGCEAPNGLHRYVEVTRDDDTPAEVDRAIDVTKRDLVGDPYRLLLQPGPELPEDAAVMVIAIGKSGDRPVAIADLPEDAYFKRGALRQWEIALDGERDDLGAGHGCVCTAGGVITPGDNQDCDTTYGDADCEPRNPNVDPNLGEICDGLGDNDCDPERLPYEDPLGCYRVVEDACYFGRRPCLDNAGSFREAHRGECATESAEHDLAPPELCERFDVSCRSDGDADRDPFECANDPYAIRVKCVARISPDGELCPRRSVRLEPLLNTPGECRWALFGGFEQVHYRAHLFPSLDQATETHAVLEQCPAFLRLDSVLGDAGRPRDDLISILFQRNEADEPGFKLLELEIEAVAVTQCPADANAAPGLECEGLGTANLAAAP